MLRSAARFSFIFGCLLVPCVVHAEEKKRMHVVAAVYSKADKSYRRDKNPDGSFRPEHYVISYGAQAEGTTTDATIDHISFGEWSELLQQHLAEQNYLPAPDPKSADLLLHVNWGRTLPYGNRSDHTVSKNQLADSMAGLNAVTSAASADGYLSPEERANTAAANSAFESALIMMMTENRVRDRANEFNGKLLGYAEEMNRWVDSPALFSAASDRLDELRGDLEEARYYILVFAFDFAAFVRKGELKIRWVTRISIRAPGNRFDENMAHMVARASRFFGGDSGGLIRRYEGTVELGETEVIGFIEDEDMPGKQNDARDTPGTEPQKNADERGASPKR